MTPSASSSRRLALAPHADLPDAIFLLADTVVAFDHAFGRLLLITNAHVGRERRRGAPPGRCGERRLDELQAAIAAPLPPRRPDDPARMLHRPHLEPGRCEQYMAAVDGRPRSTSPRATSSRSCCRSASRGRPPRSRSTSTARCAASTPRPTCSSSTSASLAGGEQPLLPDRRVAGDARAARGPGAPRSARSPAPARAARTPAQDVALEQELLADPKERAEHVMLVDLARNDLGRVCDYGSVHVPELMTVERYSHVMHIVSHVEGRLRPGCDGFDLVRATFPAGTVSGAPKIRAMEIIAELEPGAARPVRRRGRLLLLRRLPRHLHHHPHPRHARPDDQRAGRRRHRRRLGARARIPGDGEQGAGAGRSGARASPKDRRHGRRANHDRRDRQLRLVHLQPGAVPGRAGRGGLRLPQRRDHCARGSTRCNPSHIVISPGPGDPSDAGVSNDVIRELGPAAAGPGRLPGPPVHRRGVRRPGGPRARG